MSTGQCSIGIINIQTYDLGHHYSDVIMALMASQITSLTIDYSTLYLGADQRRHQSSASLTFVWGIHRWLVNSAHKGPVTRKMFPFDDIIMCITVRSCYRVVNFLPNPHKIHPIACSLGRGIFRNVFCWFKLWFVICLSHCSDVCNIVLYRTAL